MISPDHNKELSARDVNQVSSPGAAQAPINIPTSPVLNEDVADTVNDLYHAHEENAMINEVKRITNYYKEHALNLDFPNDPFT